MLLIPSIDLRGGRCVRLQQGDFGRERQYDVEPDQLVARYRAAGASWIHVVDLDGARDGVQAHGAAIAALASAPGIQFQVGGGLRSSAAIEALMSAGVARVVIGSMAVTSPQEVRDWLSRFGSERVVLAFDVILDEKGVPRCRTDGWRRQSAVSLWDALERYTPVGLRHVLCTDVERDGALNGPNLTLYREAVDRFPAIQWQASGGISGVQDLRALAAGGASAAISGRALLEERISMQELQSFLLAG